MFKRKKYGYASFRLKDLYDAIKNGEMTRSQFTVWINHYRIDNFIKGSIDGRKEAVEKFNKNLLRRNEHGDV